MVQIVRTQKCEICVRVDDSVSDLAVYCMDAAEMVKGPIGVDWETEDHSVDDVIAVVDDPDSYPRLNLATERAANEL